MVISNGLFQQSVPFAGLSPEPHRGSGYTSYFGGSTSGKIVTEQGAMQMTAVYSCVRILVEAVAGLPLNPYRYTEDGGKEKAIGHPLYLLFHNEPNPEMSSFVFRETLMTHLLPWGNAYAQVIRNGKGEVIALYPLMPNKMTVDRDERGQLYYSYQRSNDEAPTMKGNTVTLRPSDVLHIPGLGFDGLVGYSPIAMEKNSIGISPERAQFLETRKFQINEIARIFRVPPHMVGDLENSSFSNIEQQPLEFVKYTLEPWVTRWEQSIQRSLLTQEEKAAYFVKFNLEGLLRGDYQSRMNGYAIGRQNDWMSGNDIRELENLDRIPAENSWYDNDVTPQLFKDELMELFAGNGMVGFVAKERVGGKLVLPEAVRLLAIRVSTATK